MQQQLQAEQAVPGPESAGTAPMTAAQRNAIYGDSPNAPKQTSNVSQAQAEAKQKALVREKLHQDALSSDNLGHRVRPFRGSDRHCGPAYRCYWANARR